MSIDGQPQLAAGSCIPRYLALHPEKRSRSAPLWAGRWPAGWLLGIG